MVAKRKEKLAVSPDDAGPPCDEKSRDDQQNSTGEPGCDVRRDETTDVDRTFTEPFRSGFAEVGYRVGNERR